MGVRVNFTSQSTTAALSIENGSLFEGESEFEKLKIYLITLVSIRSDWEDLPWLFRSVEYLVRANGPAQAPTKTYEQLSSLQWLQIGKSNLLFDAQKIQKNPIFQISVDILRNTNFFRAFSASTSVPAIYIQQFWNSMKYDEKTRVYCCQIDEQWFNLSADLLRKALDITPVDPAHPFELPPTGDTVIDFVNQLGYPEPVEFVSNIRVNYVYQPWRAILTLINQCLTGKTSGGDKPRHPVLQMLWDCIPQTNVDHAETVMGRVYSRDLDILLTQGNDVHKRPESPCHLPGDDFLLGNLKFISKGETDEVFGMAIPKQLITQAIQQSLYYPKYLEMVAKNTKKTPQDSASKQPEPATKRAPPKKPTTTTPVKPTKPPSSKQPKSPTKKPSKRKLPHKVRKGKPFFQLVDEDDEAQQEPVPQGEGDDPALELAKKMSLDAHQEKGEGEGIQYQKQVPKLPEEVWQSKCYCNRRTIAHPDRSVKEEKRPIRPGKSPELWLDQPEPMQEDQTGSRLVENKCVPLAGPNLSTYMKNSPPLPAYPKVHENLKLITDEHVIEDNPESHSGSMSSMKNLEDTDNFGDQFLYDKPTEDDQEKSKVVNESDSTIPDPSHQTVTSTPPVIAPVIDFSSPKPSSQVTTPPINTEATSNPPPPPPTTLPEITPFIALQLRVAKLEQDMSEYLGTKLDDALLRILKRHTADLIEKYSVLLGPESIKNQESKKSPKAIIIIKRKQGEKKQESTYTIRSTDKVALEEFDLKNALFNHMNKNRTANKNPANYHLYHALMEALIADEDAMDKEVKDRVKDHKRKHDSDDEEDDDDDEGPSA
ncbi:hypothetical protein Tco_0820560 [Tanacetum coccineum]|uniref:Monodehydroascorbate reductase n=1 Tax=Tanacetum coccineum TaxID=301880 RepID=A0ABQ5A9R7_9ASTR